MVERVGRCTGVSIHGYALHSPNFDEVIWGVPPDRPGRLPKGFAVFLEQDAQFLAIGTGATKRESDGKLEAEVIAENLLDPIRLAKLWDFTCVNAFPMQRRIAARVRGALKLATQCKNTQEEVKEVGEIFEELGVNHWILVSSSDHASRVAKIAASLSLGKGNRPPWTNIEVAWSPVPYGMGPGRVVVLEAPHGGDGSYEDVVRELNFLVSDLHQKKTHEALEKLTPLLQEMRGMLDT